MKRRTRPALLLAVVLVAGLATAAQAGPITFTFAYTPRPTEGPTPAVPAFTFSFQLPDYVTSAGMFALPEPFSFDSGRGTTETITHAGTNGPQWLFGTADERIERGWVSMNWLDGPSFLFEDPSLLPRDDFDPFISGFMKAPTVRFGWVSGLTRENFPTELGQPISGMGTLMVTDAAPVPEPTSSLLVLSGLAGLAAVRRRRR